MDTIYNVEVIEGMDEVEFNLKLTAGIDDTGRDKAEPLELISPYEPYATCGPRCGSCIPPRVRPLTVFTRVHSHN